MTPQVAFALLLITVLGLVLLCVKPPGRYMADVMSGRPVLSVRLGGGIERLFYRCAGVNLAKACAASITYGIQKTFCPLQSPQTPGFGSGFGSSSSPA